jgi:hypothetical protein
MKVYVLVSDVGLNGYVIHSVYRQPPPSNDVKLAELEGARYTGYAHTSIEEHELQETL